MLVYAPGGHLLQRRMRWGVDAPEGFKLKQLHNARAQKIHGPFWGPKMDRRCVAIVTGWYEWPEVDGRKVRHLFTDAGGGLLYFPSVYDEGIGDAPGAFANFTVPAGPFVAPYNPTSRASP